MGTFDISRINFNAAKHYSSVRMQQGRVLTDDDWNENERIEDEEQRRSRVDIIGPFGSPDEGFRIENPRLDSGLINFDIHPGTLHLGGIRFELELPETYRLQKEWLQQPTSLDGTPDFDGTERHDLVYLESWQQPVSAVEDSSLFEVALGGPDTTTRVRNMRRVRVAAGIGFPGCAEAWNKLVSDWQMNHLGQVNNAHERITDRLLKVSFSKNTSTDDLCTPAVAGGYLGAENQAIRVQIIEGDKFTWGFDNGAPLYRVAIAGDGKTVTMLTEPKDQYHWPLSNQVVEILPWSAVLSNGEKIAELSGHLTKVDASYNPDTGEFKIRDSINPPLPAPPFGEDWKNRADKDELDNQTPPEYFYMRVWNRGNDLSSEPIIPIPLVGPAILGYTGLEITITGNDRVPNDYWVIAARPETPDRVIPWELEAGEGIAPHGVRRFFAPLAVIRWTRANNQLLTGKVIHDCRKRFHPLTEQQCCCTLTVGDGIRSKGDYNSIQDAIDNLPEKGGKICVLPGEHIANVSIFQKKQIQIVGCDEQSIVRPGPDSQEKAVFSILNSQKIRIEKLTIVALRGIGIEVMDNNEPTLGSEQITIVENRIVAAIHAINIRMQETKGGENDIKILNNSIGMIDIEIGQAAIFSIADGVLIERNRIVVIQKNDGKDPDYPTDPNDPGDDDPFNPCADYLKTYEVGFSLNLQIYRLLRYLFLYVPSGRSEKKYLACGGIQIGHTSERVVIRENVIIGGWGNGITLGHLNEEDDRIFFKLNAANYSYSSVYDVCIEENTIMHMGLSGVSTLLNTGRSQTYVYIKDITIYRNTITLCARQLPVDEIPAEFEKYQAFGGVILNDCDGGNIQENRIEENGLFLGAPICGVFVFHGEKMDISTNSIVNNGLPLITDDTVVRRGNRGGIVVKMSSKAADLKQILNATTPSFDGIPAVKVHDNIVVQPHGFALFLVAFGPVSVVSNQFTSMGRDGTNILSFFASTIFILNLGVSKDLLIFKFTEMANTDARQNQKLAGNSQLKKYLTALQYLPNGKVMFSGNQTTLDMRFPSRNFSLSSQFIASLDDVAFNTNQTECAGFISVSESETTFDMVLINTVLFGASVRSNDNRFTDGVTFTFYSLLSAGLMNTALGNQATHCLIVNGIQKLNINNQVVYNTNCNDTKNG